MPNYTTSKDLTFDETRWVSERRGVVFEFITDHLLRYGAVTDEAPKKCNVVLSPELANSVACHNPTEFASIILGVNVHFKINWSLKDNKLELEIS